MESQGWCAIYTLRRKNETESSREGEGEREKKKRPLHCWACVVAVYYCGVVDNDYVRPSSIILRSVRFFVQNDDSLCGYDVYYYNTYYLRLHTTMCVLNAQRHIVFCIATTKIYIFFFKNARNMQTLKIENKYHCDKNVCILWAGRHRCRHRTLQNVHFMPGMFCNAIAFGQFSHSLPQSLPCQTCTHSHTHTANTQLIGFFPYVSIIRAYMCPTTARWNYMFDSS